MALSRSIFLNSSQLTSVKYSSEYTACHIKKSVSLRLAGPDEKIGLALEHQVRLDRRLVDVLESLFY